MAEATTTGTGETRWALVTGASSGIGAALARELAARGYSLVLTARRRERLDELARELENAHAIATRCVALDLADPGAVETLARATGDEGLFVELLVNNAGYGVPGALTTPSWQQHRDFLQVMVTAPVELAYRYLPDMQRHGRGAIMNVASLAGLMPGSAGHTLYAAAKSFLIRFSQSLALENRSRGVLVSALCPGFTRSEFHDVTKARAIVEKMPKFMWLPAATVARQGVDALLRGDVVYVSGFVNRMLSLIGKHLPDRMALAFMRRQSRRFRDAH